MNSSLVGVQYRRGSLEPSEDGTHAHIDLFKRVMPRYNVTVDEALAVSMDDVVQVILEQTGGDCGPIHIVAGIPLMEAVDVANHDGEIELCPSMFPLQNCWFIFDMPPMLTCPCDNPADVHEPFPVHAMHMAWESPSVVIVDLLDITAATCLTEAWDTGDEESTHCVVLDRAGAGRLLAGIGTGLYAHPEPDQEDDYS